MRSNNCKPLHTKSFLLVWHVDERCRTCDCDYNRKLQSTDNSLIHVFNKVGNRGILGLKSLVPKIYHFSVFKMKYKENPLVYLLNKLVHILINHSEDTIVGFR